MVELLEDGRDLDALVALVRWGRSMDPALPHGLPGVSLRLEGFDTAVRALVFSPDGSQLVAGAFDGQIHAWDVASGVKLGSCAGHRRWVACFDYSADGRLLASSGLDSSVRLWNGPAGGQVRRFEGHSGLVHSVAFSPDGLRLVSGGSDGTVRLWDVTTGKQLGILEAHNGGILHVSVSRDGFLVVAGHVLTVFPPAFWGRCFREEEEVSWIYQIRLPDSAGERAVTLYSDGSYAGEGDALEWLVYEEPVTNPEPGNPLRKLHRATDVPWRRRQP